MYDSGLTPLFQVDIAANAGLAPIVTQIPNIVNADNDGTQGTGRKKREASARQGRQTANIATADLSAAANNLRDNVVINIEDIIGRTNIDSYFHYLVGVFIHFLPLYSSINVGIFDRARLYRDGQVDYQQGQGDDLSGPAGRI